MQPTKPSKARARTIWGTVLTAVLANGALLAGEVPVAVSPGSAGNETRPRPRIASPCPTFSWGAAESAKGYEIEVYRVNPSGDRQLALRRLFPTALESWTPSLTDCFERGTGYAWAVRAIGPDRPSAWSSLAHFETTPRLDKREIAAALVEARRQLGPAPFGSLPREIEGALTTLAAAQSASGSGASPASRAADPPGSILEINGSPAVTLDTLTDAICDATEIRFLDQGDGTVRDCHSGTVWLKDASCLGIGPWDGDEPVDPGSVQALLLTFNSGAELNCGDYAAGTYSDWQIPTLADLCGDWNGSCQGFGCCTAATGLLEMAYSNPAIANARDDGQWGDKDAFVDVSTSTGVIYWSNSPFGAGLAYAADISNATVFADSVGNSRYLWPVRKTP